MSGQFDLGEVALSDGLEQAVVTDVGLLLLVGPRAPGADTGADRPRGALLTPIAVGRVLWTAKLQKCYVHLYFVYIIFQ